MATTRSELRLVVRRVESVLVRVLGVVVRRGFEPVRMTAVEGRVPGTFELAITVESERPPAVLVRHLANLYDVDQVAASDHER
ncbi:MAG: ACT domain-containing protein [Acidobacteriota bacterium]